MVTTSAFPTDIIRTPEDNLEHSLRVRARALNRLREIRAEAAVGRRAVMPLGFVSAYAFIVLFFVTLWGVPHPLSVVFSSVLSGVAVLCALSSTYFWRARAHQTELFELIELRLVTLNADVAADQAALLSPKARKKLNKSKR